VALPAVADEQDEGREKDEVHEKTNRGATLIKETRTDEPIRNEEMCEDSRKVQTKREKTVRFDPDIDEGIISAHCVCLVSSLKFDPDVTTRRRPEKTNRTIVEFCCRADSVLGAETAGNKCCHKVRLTEREDMTSSFGIEFALSSVREPNTLLWASIPCTGGSPWMHLNRMKIKGMRKKLAKHLA
jgi:hypothetical protein